MRKMEIVGIGIVIVVGDLLWPNSGSSPARYSSTDTHEASISDYNGYDYSSHQPMYGSAPQNTGSQVGGDVLGGPDKARGLGGRLRRPHLPTSGTPRANSSTYEAKDD